MKKRSLIGMRSKEVRRPENPFIGITRPERAAVLGLVSGLALLVGVLNVTRGRVELVGVLLAGLTYLGILAMPIMLYREEWGWFHPIIFLPLWTLVTGVIPSMEMFISGLETHSALPGMGEQELNRLVVQRWLLEGLGWLVFYGGATIGRIRTIRVLFPNRRYIGARILVVAIVAAGALLVLMAAAGGVDALVLQRGVRAEERVAAEIGGQWTFIVRQALPIACLIWLGLQPTVARKLLFWLLASTGLGMAFAATGSRSSVLVPVVMGFIIWILRTRRVPHFGIAAGAAVAFIVVGVGGEFREESWHVDSVGQVEMESGIISGFVRGVREVGRKNTENDALIAILARVPDEVGLLYGRSYLSVPASPIPSRLWPGKPDAGGRLTGELIFGRPRGGGGVSPGTAGEAFWNFHLLGVIVVFFTWGRLANWLATFYRQHSQQGAAVVVYVVTLFTFSPNSVAFYTWFHSVTAALLLIMFFCGRPRLVKRGSHPG